MKKRKPRSDGRYSINISFTENEVDLIEHVDERGNFSSYVKYLIRKDMQGANNIPLDLIQGLLKNNIQNKNEEQKEQKEEKPKPNKTAINNILNKKIKGC